MLEQNVSIFPATNKELQGGLRHLHRTGSTFVFIYFAERRTTDLRPRMSPPRHSPGAAGTKHPPHLGQTTPTPNIRNTTMPPHTGKGACGF